MEKIKVLLAEDHTIVRKGLRSLLEQDFHIVVVGEAGDGHEALGKAEKLHPDIIVLDISMPLLNGLEVARQLSQLHPDIKILILSMHDSEEMVLKSLEAGAKGYVLKKAVPDELITAINRVFYGKTYFSPSIEEMIQERMAEQGQPKKELTQQPVLTKRQREIIQLVAEGYSSKEIAKMLKLSIKTVENHRTNIMNKLKLNGITDWIKYAISKGIIHLDNK